MAYAIKTTMLSLLFTKSSRAKRYRSYLERKVVKPYKMTKQHEQFLSFKRKLQRDKIKKISQ